MILVIFCAVVAVLVVGTVVFEIVGLLVERKARERFEKRFKYQNEMRKKQL